MAIHIDPNCNCQYCHPTVGFVEPITNPSSLDAIMRQLDVWAGTKTYLPKSITAVLAEWRAGRLTGGRRP